METESLDMRMYFIGRAVQTFDCPDFDCPDFDMEPILYVPVHTLRCYHLYALYNVNVCIIC